MPKHRNRHPTTSEDETGCFTHITCTTLSTPHARATSCLMYTCRHTRWRWHRRSLSSRQGRPAHPLCARAPETYTTAKAPDSEAMTPRWRLCRDTLGAL